MICTEYNELLLLASQHAKTCQHRYGLRRLDVGKRGTEANPTWSYLGFRCTCTPTEHHHWWTLPESQVWLISWEDFQAWIQRCPSPWNRVLGGLLLSERIRGQIADVLTFDGFDTESLTKVLTHGPEGRPGLLAWARLLEEDEVGAP